MSSVSDRVKEVRQKVDGKKLSQAEFGARLGVSRDVISNIEYGRVEPTEIVIRSIVRDFGVNEIWLRTGEGEMFAPMTEQEELASAVGRLLRDDGDEYKRQLILAISDLQPETIKDIVKTLKQRFGGSSEEK